MGGRWRHTAVAKCQVRLQSKGCDSTGSSFENGFLKTSIASAKVCLARRRRNSKGQSAGRLLYEHMDCFFPVPEQQAVFRLSYVNGVICISSGALL